MRWQGREQSENVEDARHLPSGGGMLIGGGLGTILIVIVAMLLGVKPQNLLDQLGQGQGAAPGAQAPADPARDEEEEPLRQFVGVVLKDTETVWTRLLPQLKGNHRYVAPKLRLFRQGTESGCGHAQSAVGPFYCPNDSKVYLDLDFFRELNARFKAPGDFAMAYVVAHEVGHHVQNLLGLSDQVHQAQQQANSKQEANEMSVRLELQADFLAGVWVHHNQQLNNVLEKGDLEEAINAASRIGDDVLQKQSTGRVRPDAFTHGTAAQRVRWLKAGIQSGDINQLMLPFQVPYDQL
jgi:uncharacterized protein